MSASSNTFGTYSTTVNGGKKRSALFEDSFKPAQEPLAALLRGVVGFLVRVPVRNLRAAAMQGACFDGLRPGQKHLAAGLRTIRRGQLAGIGIDIRGDNPV